LERTKTFREVTMDSQKLAGVWATIIAAIVLAAAFYYVPRNDQFAVRPGAPAAKPVEKAAAPAVRGPVVREVPNGTEAPTGAPAGPVVRGPVVREVPQ
jgi:hypothetical protein